MVIDILCLSFKSPRTLFELITSVTFFMEQLVCKIPVLFFFYINFFFFFTSGDASIPKFFPWDS